MKYEKIVKAKFISRPNRFVADVMLEGKEISVSPFIMTISNLSLVRIY